MDLTALITLDVRHTVARVVPITRNMARVLVDVSLAGMHGTGRPFDHGVADVSSEVPALHGRSTDRTDRIGHGAGISRRHFDVLEVVQLGNHLGYQVTQALQVRFRVLCVQPHGLQFGQPRQLLRQSFLAQAFRPLPARTGTTGTPQSNASTISLRTQSPGSRNLDWKLIQSAPMTASTSALRRTLVRRASG